MILWPADVPLLGWQGQNSHAFPEPGRQLPQDGEMDDKWPWDSSQNYVQGRI